METRISLFTDERGSDTSLTRIEFIKREIFVSRFLLFQNDCSSRRSRVSMST